MDAQVGKVLGELDAQGVANSTVVAFLGDHGWQLGDLGEFGKKTNFERATRAPLIIRDPRSTAAAATSSALVEFVDLMPTLMGLALGTAAVPPLCPEVSTAVPLCTEGRSLAPLMADPAGTRDARRAAFMQYAYCMHDEPAATGTHAGAVGPPWHDGCAGEAEPRVMGYALRTRRWRYVEWVRFDKTTLPPTPLWDQRVGTELYDHSVGGGAGGGAGNDTIENAAEAVNRVAEPSLRDTVAALSRQLRAGWRADRVVGGS